MDLVMQQFLKIGELKREQSQGRKEPSYGALDEENSCCCKRGEAYIGYSVTNVKPSTLKYVHFLMVEENDGEQAEYTCPNCYVEEVEKSLSPNQGDRVGRCYEAEQRLENRDRHPVNSRDMHDLYPIEINDVPADTKDKDEIVESEFFDTRQAFLSLCQGNHYQYDTLRRAKHSSMMVLYHLHNPTAPAFVTTCNVCYHDIETGQGWRCEICPEFDVCNTCYQRMVLRKMLDLLVHASQCCFPHCQYPNCRKVKGLFRHGIQCKTRVSGGCVLCKKMWYLLQLHARACKESECHVPRCRDLKEHLKRLQQQSESRRRAAVMEMMRQRAAELQAIDD
ncbi:hypothetical protein HPP92_019997 [Vanilla planifolia]|uniref:histone acetyltransferase n=1 Tax=Vanilla planifolia TaxID=51239 RepID=A0A835ULG7_VANPL|nr:hypothetical protein HPP92_019997 [Vanilla planifolia]